MVPKLRVRSLRANWASHLCDLYLSVILSPRHGCFFDGFHSNPFDIVTLFTATVAASRPPPGYGYRAVYCIPG